MFENSICHPGDRRFKILKVDAGLMAEMFRRDDKNETHFVRMSGMPDDAEIVGATFSEMTGLIIFKVWSATFDQGIPGHEFETLEINYVLEKK